MPKAKATANSNIEPHGPRPDQDGPGDERKREQHPADPRPDDRQRAHGRRLLRPACRIAAPAPEGHGGRPARRHPRQPARRQAQRRHAAPLRQHGRVGHVEEQGEQEAQPSADEEVQRHLCHAAGSSAARWRPPQAIAAPPVGGWADERTVRGSMPGPQDVLRATRTTGLLGRGAHGAIDGAAHGEVIATDRAGHRAAGEEEVVTRAVGDVRRHDRGAVGEVLGCVRCRLLVLDVGAPGDQQVVRPADEHEGQDGPQDARDQQERHPRHDG